MDRTLYSIEETGRVLGAFRATAFTPCCETGSLSSVVIGCRRFVSAEAIAALISGSTSIGEPIPGRCTVKTAVG